MSVARRAPASIDMRAALAALYWSKVCQFGTSRTPRSISRVISETIECDTWGTD